MVQFAGFLQSLHGSLRCPGEGWAGRAGAGTTASKSDPHGEPALAARARARGAATGAGSVTGLPSLPAPVIPKVQRGKTQQKLEKCSPVSQRALLSHQTHKGTVLPNANFLAGTPQPPPPRPSCSASRPPCGRPTRGPAPRGRGGAGIPPHLPRGAGPPQSFGASLPPRLRARPPPAAPPPRPGRETTAGSGRRMGGVTESDGRGSSLGQS